MGGSVPLLLKDYHKEYFAPTLAQRKVEEVKMSNYFLIDDWLVWTAQLLIPLPSFAGLSPTRVIVTIPVDVLSFVCKFCLICFSLTYFWFINAYFDPNPGPQVDAFDCTCSLREIWPFSFSFASFLPPLLRDDWILDVF